MSFLDSLMENMTVVIIQNTQRTRGCSAERISFMEISMDESSRKMISKSLSKVGKSKEVLNKQNQSRLKAVYKLGLLYSKKLRTIKFNFFVNFQELAKQIKCERKVENAVQNRPEVNETKLNCQIREQKKQQFKLEQKREQPNKQLLGKMLECLSVLKQKHYSLDNKQYGFLKILKQSKNKTRLNSAISKLNNFYRRNNFDTKLCFLEIIKSRNKQIERIQLFVDILSLSISNQQSNLLKQALKHIHELSSRFKQKSDIETKQKQLTQDHSLLSLKQHLKDLQKQTPILQLRFTKDQIFQVDTSKSIKSKKYFCRQMKEMKSPSISIIQPELSINSNNISNIFAQRIQKVNKQTKSIAPLKLSSSSHLIIIPRQQQKFGFFSRPQQHVPQQLHKLYPHQLSSQIQDTTEPLGLFHNVSKQVFRQVNYQLSKPKTQRDFNKTKKQKIISLKNSFIEPPKKFQYPFCSSSKNSKVFTLAQSRKSFGLKSSRRIKESCVGEEWQRVDLSKLMKTQSFSPGKSSSKDTTIKITSSTARPKCINSISFVKAQLFSKNYLQNSKGCNQVKRVTSICSQFLNRLTKS